MPPHSAAPPTVDNVTVSAYGDSYVAEGGAEPAELVVIGAVGGNVSSQRGPAPAGNRGITYETTGPFR